MTSPAYEELYFGNTALGELLLRRRRVAGLGGEEIYEVKLNDELLMSSLLTESERELARRSLPLVPGEGFDVLVGGLGLGHTAREVLRDPRVREVTVVEILPEVIGWHERGLVPLGPELSGEPRCRFLEGDFFRLVTVAQEDLGCEEGYGAVLVDIDHAPDSWLHPDHEEFYGESGLNPVKGLLRDGGVFGFWSSGPPNEAFVAGLSATFDEVESHEVEVMNPLVCESQTDTVYVARLRARSHEM